MRFIDDTIKERRIRKYGELAHHLRTSHTLLTSSVSSASINILDYMKLSNGVFSKYQELIKSRVGSSYNTDFLDYTLLMGEMFGIYNMYCYFPIREEVRKELINNQNINPVVTYNFIKNNADRIYKYLNNIFSISKDEFIDRVCMLFKLRDDYKYYNDAVLRELSFILMGSYLKYKKGIDTSFIDISAVVSYFHNLNDSDKKIRVY